jgi:TRAP-type C4-dicarboxylate transport system permease small subunit
MESAAGGMPSGRWQTALAQALATVLAVLAGTALFALMLLTFADVMGRKFWVSIPGALELTEMLMVVVVFAGLPLVAWHGRHVGLELTDTWYRGRAARWSGRFMEGVCALVFGALAVAAWRHAGRTLADGEVSTHLKLPVGAFIYLMAMLLALAALMHLLRLAGGAPPAEPGDTAATR